MQSTSTEAPTRATVKRFTNKILFLSRLIKRIDFVQELHLRTHVLQERIEYGDGHHTLHDDTGPLDDGRVMTALDFDRDVVALFVRGFLRAGDGRGRLQASPRTPPR